MVALGRTVSVGAVLVLATACGSQDPCADPPPDDPTCPDLSFRGELYDEWRPVDKPATTEELGNAPYPACNDEEPCNGPDLGGFAVTDVWLLEGVDPERALIGYRQGTEISVVFVRRGVDPEAIEGLPAAVRPHPH